MAGLARRSLPDVLRMLGVFFLGCVVDHGLGRLQSWLANVASVLRWEKGADFFYVDSGLRLVEQVHAAFASVLYVGAVVTFAAAFVRPVWRRRQLRGGSSNRLADAARRHPAVADRVVPWAAGVIWLLLSAGLPFVVDVLTSLAWGHAFAVSVHDAAVDLAHAVARMNNLGYLFGSILAIAGVAKSVQWGIRTWLRDPEAAAAPPEPIGDKGSFSAVAVTASTRTAVAGLGVVSLGMAWFAATGRSDGQLAAAVFAYVLVALGTATLFRRVSRIVVGIDGILVLGADRTRFVAYAGLDGVKASGSDILLHRGGTTSLRLQLHDDDVTRAPALAARIQAAMDDAVRMRAEGADRLMQTTQGTAAASQRLASGSRGGLDYRQPAIAREQLWQLVEGPVSDAGARRVAAEALSPDMTRDEKERLRVVATKCAEPKARVALEALLERGPGEEDAQDEIAPAIVPRRRFS